MPVGWMSIFLGIAVEKILVLVREKFLLRKIILAIYPYRVYNKKEKEGM